MLRSGELVRGKVSNSEYVRRRNSADHSQPENVLQQSYGRRLAHGARIVGSRSASFTATSATAETARSTYRSPRGRFSAPITKTTAPAKARTIFQASIPKSVAPLALTASAPAVTRPIKAFRIARELWTRNEEPRTKNRGPRTRLSFFVRLGHGPNPLDFPLMRAQNYGVSHRLSRDKSAGINLVRRNWNSCRDSPISSHRRRERHRFPISSNATG